MKEKDVGVILVLLFLIVCFIIHWLRKRFGGGGAYKTNRNPPPDANPTQINALDNSPNPDDRRRAHEIRMEQQERGREDRERYDRREE